MPSPIGVLQRHLPHGSKRYCREKEPERSVSVVRFEKILQRARLIEAKRQPSSVRNWLPLPDKAPLLKRTGPFHAQERLSVPPL
jgi:hypothetical protein